MRIQMGNNNVSGGLQEEEKSSAVEAQENIAQETVHDELRIESDDKDLHEKVEELTPDDHHLGDNESSDGKAKDNTEEVEVKDTVSQATGMDGAEGIQTEFVVVQTRETKSEHVVEPMEVPTKTSGDACTVDESQTTPSKPSSDSEKLLEVNLEKHDFEASDPKITLQLSVGRETEEVEERNSVSNANFTSGDVLDLKSNDQHEPDASQDEPRGEDLRAIERPGELLELNLSDDNQDKLPLIGDRTAEHRDVSLISDTSNQDVGNKINDAVAERNFLETIRINEEKLEQLWVPEDERGSTAIETEHISSSDLRDKGEKRVDSSQEVSVPQDKSIVLTEESKEAGKKAENEEVIYDSVASQPGKLKTSFDCERNAKENASDSNSNTNSVPEMENPSQIEDHSVSKKFEDAMEKEPEVRTVLTTLTAIDPNKKQENSTEVGLGRISIESNEETKNNQVDLRRSPSFDFDLSLGSRYEDSDQTPLLCHDKAATRSKSSRDVLTFQTTPSMNQYGRNQAIEVEVKTIRMERSDSDKPRAPFMSLLKKEGNVNAFVELKQEEAPLSEEATVNSTRVNGKRKPRASLFNICICCVASNP